MTRFFVCIDLHTYIFMEIQKDICSNFYVQMFRSARFYELSGQETILLIF